MNTLQQLFPFTCQLAIGIAVGFLLCASGFCDPKENASAIRVSGANLILATLSFLAAGALAIQLCRLAKIDLPDVCTAELLRCVAGGAVCGAGYALCSCGLFSSIAAPGKGNLYPVAILFGAVLSLAGLKKLDNLHPGMLEFSIQEERVFSASGTDVFSWENPAAYVIAGCLILILFTKLILSNKNHQ